MSVSIYFPAEKKATDHVKVPSKFIAHHVMPGQVITGETGYLRGHGTYEKDGKLYASVSGVVERVNKLISVKPLKARYQGEVGDAVVGRITEVGQKLWRVDVNGKQDAILQLSAITLPGGELRRRTTEDERQMRSFFVENDLISAEIQQTKADGLLVLHTRSTRYGKLVNGLMVTVHSALVKRVKSHFYTFAFGVEIILGINGNIWITKPRSETEDDDERKEVVTISSDLRQKMARVRNSILALNTLFVAIYPDTIMDVFEASVEGDIAIKDMLKPDIMIQITETARARGQPM